MATKHKITLTLPPGKPRNPFVGAALSRRAGSHAKPHKVIRQQARQRLQRSLDGLLGGDHADLDFD